MKINRVPAILLLAALFCAPAAAQKLKAVDVLARHLDSIGTAEKRASIKNQLVVGEVQVKFVSQKHQSAQGRLVMASEGDKMFMGMNLNAADYPSEKFSFDGKRAKVGVVRTSGRSVLGSFVVSNNALLEQSLLGGTLASSWALHDAAGKKAKVSFEGSKKIDGKEVYVLGYSPKGGSDVDIRIYFDRETFRHVRTEYRRTSSAGIGLRPEQSSGYSETRLKVTEDFGDFQTENGLTLPRSYRLNYLVSGQNGTTEIEWVFNLTEFAFNQNIDEATFDAEAN